MKKKIRLVDEQGRTIIEADASSPPDDDARAKALADRDNKRDQFRYLGAQETPQEATAIWVQLPEKVGPDNPKLSEKTLAILYAKFNLNQPKKKGRAKKGKAP